MATHGYHHAGQTYKKTHMKYCLVPSSYSSVLWSLLRAPFNLDLPLSIPLSLSFITSLSPLIQLMLPERKYPLHHQWRSRCIKEYHGSHTHIYITFRSTITEHNYEIVATVFTADLPLTALTVIIRNI